MDFYAIAVKDLMSSQVWVSVDPISSLESLRPLQQGLL
jgi:hypothetical protein